MPYINNDDSLPYITCSWAHSPPGFGWCYPCDSRVCQMDEESPDYLCGADAHDFCTHAESKGIVWDESNMNRLINEYYLYKSS